VAGPAGPAAASSQRTEQARELWTEAIDPLLQGRSDRQVIAACGGLLDDLASLFHRVAVIRGSFPDREPPLPRLLRGLAAMLRNLAGQGPVIAACCG
jgi:hypothetical protein